ncbi:uncharacterized protein EDB91DRAFT_1263398 [Suillus paluster]|uniref:uncharacterized protein n=1 Tax=Suillus paluster TaxID=48578 RepID=UPI001B864C89|nr:uncharacterized protein EDB91DRAFT_1263398 [Suillus paluster]KAG1726878.1 hypothetical protein EDB91DRAFT_1263398 [Suillus paluster]
MAYRSSASFRPEVAGQSGSSHPRLISHIPLQDEILEIEESRSRPIYEDMKNIQYWIKTVNSNEMPDINCNVPSSPNGIFTHPFNSFSLYDHCDMQDEGDGEYGSCDGLGGLVTFDISAWLAHDMPSLSDSSDDTTAASAISDAAPQYIDIAWDSPWYRLPGSCSPITSSPPHDSYSCACSPDVRQAMEQQELLLDLFHDELRRIIPSSHGYNSAWLEDVDPDLVLSPVQSYEELCWQSAVSEIHVTRKPFPDVPVGPWDVNGAF